MALGKFQAKGIMPPNGLGVSEIVVKVGQTVNITKQMLMTSTPIYTQPMQSDGNIFGLPIGGIKIVNHIGDYREALAQTNQTQTLCYLTNNGARIYRTSDTSTITNNTINNSTLVGNLLKVTGVKIGVTQIKYVAKAISGSTESTEYSEVIGTIIIRVIQANQPPSSIGNSLTLYPTGGSITVEMGSFNQMYSDPDGDPIWKVRINSYDTGQLFYNGVLVTNGQEILASHIEMGMLVFVGLGLSENTISNINFSVCDTGSGTYIT